MFRISNARFTLLTPDIGPVGTVITAEGLGFGNQQLVWIDFGTKMTIATTISSSDGTFSVTFLVNSQPYIGVNGTRTITATGYVDGGVTDSCFRENFFWILSSVVCSPKSDVVGTVIEVVGAGWKPIEEVRIMFGTERVSYGDWGSGYKKFDGGGTITSTNGTFSATFIVNTQPYGTTVFTVRGYQSDESWRATSTFFIRTNIIYLDPQTDTVQSVVTIRGTGYGSCSLIQIDFGTKETITTTISSIHGTFSTTFRVNTQPANTRVITVKDITTLIPDAFSTTLFQIKSDIIIVNPSSNFVGEVVTVEGRGEN